MIKKGSVSMGEPTREMTLEELKEKHKVMTEEYNTLSQQIKQKEKEAEDKRRAELEAEKEARQKEITDAYKKYNVLVKQFIKDYGAFSLQIPPSDYFDLWSWLVK